MKGLRANDDQSRILCTANQGDATNVVLMPCLWQSIKEALRLLGLGNWDAFQVICIQDRDSTWHDLSGDRFDVKDENTNLLCCGQFQGNNNLQELSKTNSEEQTPNNV